MAADVEEAVYSRLAAFSGLTALVSNRIYAGILPDDPTFPAVTYTLIGATRYSAMGADISLASRRVQVSIWDVTKLSVRNVAQQVRGALQRFSGVSGGVTVQGIYIEEELDLYEPETKRQYRVQDYIVHAEE